MSDTIDPLNSETKTKQKKKDRTCEKEDIQYMQHASAKQVQRKHAETHAGNRILYSDRIGNWLRLNLKVSFRAWRCGLVGEANDFGVEEFNSGLRFAMVENPLPSNVLRGKKQPVPPPVQSPQTFIFEYKGGL